MSPNELFVWWFGGGGLGFLVWFWLEESGIHHVEDQGPVGVGIVLWPLALPCLIGFWLCYWMVYVPVRTHARWVKRRRVQRSGLVDDKYQRLAKQEVEQLVAED